MRLDFPPRREATGREVQIVDFGKDRGSAVRRKLWPWLISCCLLLPCVLAAQSGTDPTLAGGGSVDGVDAVPADSSLPRDPLEIEALLQPEAVLEKLPGALEKARADQDSRRLALLYLAEANACRVVADWICQRNAGVNAFEAAEGAKDPILAMRGLIAESRAAIALKDFSRGEKLLGDAELRLAANPSPELSADIFLAYSSLSFILGNEQRAADYAQRGLDQLKAGEALAMQARLLRNLARAQAQLGLSKAATRSLDLGLEITRRINDPKLMAEFYLGVVRVARLSGDAAKMRENGLMVLELSKQLKNSQLQGMGHEALGLAALDVGDRATARLELQAAYSSFQSLGLDRDELRLARNLISVLIESKDDETVNLSTLVRRFLELDIAVRESDRLQAADDFDARLKYAQQELDLVRLESEATLAREREAALTETNRLTLFLGLLGAVVVIVLATFFLQQRRSTQRLQRAFQALNESEARASDLLQESRGFVFLHDANGVLLMVNPAAAEVLGQSPEQLIGSSFREFIAGAGREAFDAYLHRVGALQQDEGTFLIRAKDGTHRHWRFSSRVSVRAKSSSYVIGQAVDVTDQVRQSEQLRQENLRDALTGAFNRRYLDVFERDNDASRWGVINIDLDHFKQINDRQGHERGDQVLIGIARFLEDQVRDIDAVVRAGGDEFVVLLKDASEALVEALLNRLRRDAASAPCAFSLGAALRDEDETLSSTLARADSQMYSARRSARGEASG